MYVSDPNSIPPFRLVLLYITSISIAIRWRLLANIEECVGTAVGTPTTATGGTMAVWNRDRYALTTPEPLAYFPREQIAIA